MICGLKEMADVQVLILVLYLRQINTKHFLDLALEVLVHHALLGFDGFLGIDAVGWLLEMIANRQM